MSPTPLYAVLYPDGVTEIPPYSMLPSRKQAFALLITGVAEANVAGREPQADSASRRMTVLPTIHWRA